MLIFSQSSKSSKSSNSLRRTQRGFARLSFGTVGAREAVRVMGWRSGEGWHCDDNKGGWLDTELCAKARCEEVEHTRRHNMYERVPRETCLRKTGKGPIKTGWAETDKGRLTCARGGSRRSTTHAWPELYASTPPLEALKVVLSEIATGDRKRKVVALVDVRRAYFYAPREVECSSHCRHRIVRRAMTTAAVQPVRHARRRAELGGGACGGAQQIQGRVPICVAKPYRRRTCRGNRARG